MVNGALTDMVNGVLTADGRHIPAGAVVLTTGTFLRGLIHIGERKIPAGRIDEAPALGLSTRLYGLGLRMGRLKTGTPPRLDGRSIDWSGLQVQHGDDPPRPFSFLTTTDRHAASGLPHHPHQRRPPTPSSPPISIARRCTPAPSRASARAIVLRSKTRSSASRSAAATRSFSSLKVSTTTPSIRTASRPRCPRTCSMRSSRPSRVSRPRASSGPAMPSSTIMSIRAS